MGEKVVIITGAASGIGKALSTKLASRGWRVGLVDINAEAGKQLETELGPNAFFAKADVASYEAQVAAFSAIFTHWGRLDAVCANAGITDRSSLYMVPAVGLDLAAVDSIPPPPDLTATDVDYKGVLYSTQLAIHFMRHSPGRPGGKILAASSIAGVFPHPTLPEYSGAKGAVINFVRAAGPVLRIKEKIALSAVCPGLIRTPIFRDEVWAALDPRVLTPVETAVRGYEQLLDEEGDAKAGEVILCVGSDIVPVPAPDMGAGSDVDEDSGAKMMEAAMEPLFRALHGTSLMT
ncbi:hypothetical protein B0T26DRAFT_831226 [Lasiosphaeria miniovina]|uniref:15-hydroxyprostaglandin dehydrogenase n=1 Tax=Lasiosphaeria miniovina TaxID=1954250 RepID=A0AA40AMQ4_9PEZI|nr:uncharacterized protein B0T26DRAFT_831226 [Lasiosphaeria miniovina]KAK0718664.1 hypothetical protein B0T26DRAFT_831226 [Lasiosphaeria miniovina]